MVLRTGYGEEDSFVAHEDSCVDCPSSILVKRVGQVCHGYTSWNVSVRGDRGLTGWDEPVQESSSEKG